MGKRKIPLAVALPGIGARIMLAREFLRMSKADLARALDVTPSAVTQWEKGAAEPGIDHMLKLKREHRIPLDWIYAEDTEAPRPEFLRFIVDFGARPDAPEIARRLRAQWGLPVPMAQSGVAADDVAQAILQRHPAAPRRGRPPRHTLHEDPEQPQD